MLALAAVAVGAFVVAGALGIGEPLLALCDRPVRRPARLAGAERAEGPPRPALPLPLEDPLRGAVALGLGLLAIGDLALLLGLLGHVRSLPGTALLLLALAGGITRLPRLGRAIAGPGRLGFHAAWIPLGLLALALVALATVPTLFYDSLLYHLGSPRAWIDAGRIEAEPFLIQTGLPMAGEAAFLVAMRLGDLVGAGNESAQVVNALLALGLLLGVAVAARVSPAASVVSATSAAADGGPGEGGDHQGRRSGAGTIAAFLLAGSPLFLELAFLPKSDMLAAYLALLAVVTAWRGATPLLVGVLLGGALTAKTTAFAIVLLPVVVLVVRRARRTAQDDGLGGTMALDRAAGSPRRGGSGLALGLLAVGAFLALAPWGCRAGLFALRGDANPLRSAGASGLAAFRATTGERTSPSERIRGVLGVPRELLVGGQGSASYPGLVFVPALAAGLLGARRDGIARLALGSGLAALLARAALSSMPRFGLVAYALLAVAGARGLGALSLARWRPLGVVIGVGALLLGVLGVVQTVVFVGGAFAPQAVLFGREGRDAYLARRLPTHRAVTWANANLHPADPERERVLLVGEALRAYLRVPQVVVDAYHENPLDLLLARETNATAVAEALRERGIAWILVNRSEQARFLAGLGHDPAATLAREDRFLLTQGILLYRDEAASIFAIR